MATRQYRRSRLSSTQSSAVRPSSTQARRHRRARGGSPRTWQGRRRRDYCPRSSPRTDLHRLMGLGRQQRGRRCISTQGWLRGGGAGHVLQFCGLVFLAQRRTAGSSRTGRTTCRRAVSNSIYVTVQKKPNKVSDLLLCYR